jgi:hypothetical protein
VRRLLLRVPENLRPRLYNTWVYLSAVRFVFPPWLIWVAGLFVIAAVHTNPPLFWLGMVIFSAISLLSEKGR